jgi:hypothetical protein
VGSFEIQETSTKGLETHSVISSREPLGSHDSKHNRKVIGAEVALMNLQLFYDSDYFYQLLVIKRKGSNNKFSMSYSATYIHKIENLRHLHEMIGHLIESLFGALHFG